MLSEVQSKCWVRGRTEHHERESTTNRNENPKDGRPKPQKRREELNVNPWGVTMISRGVEISIGGGGGEMFRVLSLGCFFAFLF